MVVVKIELHSANTNEVTEIGRMLICNDGTSSVSSKGNYDVKLGRKGKTDNLSVFTKPQRTAKVSGYNRISDSVWVLVSKALKELGIK